MEGNIKIFVVDSSYVLSFLLKEDSSVKDFFQKYINHENELISTDLLKYEVGNGLKSAFLAKRISREKAKELYKEFFNLKIAEYQPEFPEILKSTFLKDLSFYDAAYFILSQNKKLPLLTLDKKLQRLSGKNS